MVVDKTHTLLFVLYGAIVALAVVGLFIHPAKPTDTTFIVWLMIAGISACGAIIELILHLRTKSTIRKMEHQVSMMMNSEAPGIVMLEEHLPGKEFASILNQFLSLVSEKFDELRYLRREFDLLLAASEAERQNTEAILGSVSDGVVIVNHLGELVLINELAAEIFNIDPAQDRNKPITDLIRDEKILKFFDPSYWQDRNETERFERHLRFKSAVRVYLLTFTPVFVNKENLWAVVLTLNDITHDKELEKARNDFVNHVSHELRVPLSSIKAYIELLVDDEVDSDSERKEFYKIIKREAERLDRFVANVLDMSRIESGKMSVEFVTISLNSVMNEVVSLIQSLAEEKEIKLITKLPIDEVQVRADNDLFRQMVINLLSNAVKYTPRGGVVQLEVEVDSSGGIYIVRVRDTGVGFPEKDSERIFEKFYRVDNGSSGGTGLGLTLVKKVAEDIYGGKINVHSKVGEGSTFELVLPLNPEGVPARENIDLGGDYCEQEGINC